MSKQLDIKVERDHLISLTRASAKSSIAELIWNSLDADSSRVEVKIISNSVGIDSIEVMDNGNGINFIDAEKIFGTIGGSIKKAKQYSPGLRSYHGKEGKGRFKSMALGDLIKYVSRFKSNGKTKSFSVHWNKNELKHPVIEDSHEVKKNKDYTGVLVKIENIIQDNAGYLLGEKIIHELEAEFAVYYLKYPAFDVYYNGHKLDFRHLINHIEETTIKFVAEAETHDFKIQLLEWSIDIERKLHYCNNTGVTFLTDKLGIRAGSYPISVYIMSDYIEVLQREGKLILQEMDPVISGITDEAKKFAREYVRRKIHESAKDFIDELKKENIYPYKEPPSGSAETVERQVFDIVALHINDYLPSFTEQENDSKKFTLSLVKQALESDTKALQNIFNEVLNLPKEKIDELNEILETSTLTTVIDTFKLISDRLKIIEEIRLLLFDKKYKDKVKERQHLHQIVKDETWMFGDDYTYGADDVNLKHVLQAYLEDLGRQDFTEVIESKDNSHLEDIPDICLWKQYNKGQAGYYKNLVIELKRPNKTITTTEIDQIKRYARTVSADERFPKEKTSWVFILLTTKLNKDAEFEYEQADRVSGHIYHSANVDVFLIKWGDLLNQAEARHQFLKEKINANIHDDDKEIVLLKKKYEKYLPTEITQEKIKKQAKASSN
jgi:hypothetical protein